MGELNRVRPNIPEWFHPETYSAWVYEPGENREPIMVVVYEWEAGGLRCVRVQDIWVHEEETGQQWHDHPEFENMQRGLDPFSFASLVEAGKLHRIGPMPAIASYTDPPFPTGDPPATQK
jgi:hypothetical protein